MKLARKINTVIEAFRGGGLGAVTAKSRQVIRRISIRRSEQNWIRKYGVLSEKERIQIRDDIQAMPRRPKVAILMPVYNIDEKWLRKCIDSVRGQMYQDWELCIVDDHSPSPHIKIVLDHYSKLDSRIRVVYRTENGHISVASNDALEMATGEFCILLDHDDELSEDAVYSVAREIVEDPNVAMIYSDEDMIDDKGHRFDLKFKPDFSRDLLLSINLVTHLSAYRADLLRKVGGFRIGTEGSQDYDLALRVIDEISSSQIRHIPRVLYHWRAIPGSVALSGDEKPYAHDRARTAISDHLKRIGSDAVVEPTNLNFHRVRYSLPEETPRVTVITIGDRHDRIGDYLAILTDYSNVEYRSVPADNDLANRLNNSIATASGDVICLIDTAVVPKCSDWLSELLSFAVQADIGAIGGKVIDKHRRVVDGGLVFGGSELVNVAHFGFAEEEAGNMFRGIVVGNYSAVSMSCFAFCKSNFNDIGGFDTTLPMDLIDADLCLRMGEGGLRIVFDPYAVFQLKSGSKLAKQIGARKGETTAFEERWRDVIARDPFYNCNLDPEDGQFRIKI